MEKIVVYNTPASPVSEAYRTLCTNVLAGLGGKKLIEVTDAANENDTSMVVANLATAMAQAGKRVLLMDCNLRNPKQHEIFGLQNKGLTDCLSVPHNYEIFVQQSGQCNLCVLTAGSTVTNPIEVLLSQPMQELLDFVRDAYDIVLLSIPAADSMADAAALGSKMDGALLVLTNKQDKVEQAQKAKDALVNAGVSIMGCVLNKVNVS